MTCLRNSPLESNYCAPICEGVGTQKGGICSIWHKHTAGARGWKLLLSFFLRGRTLLILVRYGHLVRSNLIFFQLHSTLPFIIMNYSLCVILYIYPVPANQHYPNYLKFL